MFWGRRTARQRHARRAAGALLCALLPAPTHAAGGRVALVIGNAAYQHTHPLDTPTADAALIGGRLRQAGFDVEIEENLTNQQMLDVVSRFRDKADTADLALVYFAGHGVQAPDPAVADGVSNFLIPIDADLRDLRDARTHAVSLNVLIGEIAHAGQYIVILDACRNDPFPSARSTGGRGLAPVTTAAGAGLTVFSTQAGKTAEDKAGQDGAHSPFALALGRYMLSPGLEFHSMLNKVRRQVRESTPNGQTPENQKDTLEADVFLVPDGAQLATLEPTPPPPAPLPAPTPAPVPPPAPAPVVVPAPAPVVTPKPPPKPATLAVAQPPVPKQPKPRPSPAIQPAQAGDCAPLLRAISRNASLPPPGVTMDLWRHCGGS